MRTELSSLLSGFVIGLGAGITPGPLTLLVIAQTLRHNLKEGTKVAIAPLITDLPILFVSLLVFSRLAQVHLIIAVISFAGAFFLTRLALENLRTGPVEVRAVGAAPRSLFKGILTNLLSPHPYLFWISVGSPILTRAAQSGWLAPSAFVAGMLGAMVGIKILLALVIRRSSGFLKGKIYLGLVRVSGVALLAFAVLFVRDGLRQLGWF